MNVLSLFDGISCGRIALERAGIKVDKYYASEINEKAIKVSQSNYPDIIRLGDVTKWLYWDIDWEKIDLIIGGSPCQGFSLAGNQQAFSDPRSKLFYEFANITHWARLCNPDVIYLLENVKMKAEYLDHISDQLPSSNRIRINSSLVSAQLRDRYYWSNRSMSMPKDKSIKLSDILTNGFTERDKSRALLESGSRPVINPHALLWRYRTTGLTTVIYKDKETCERCHDAHKKINYRDNPDLLSLTINDVRIFNQTELERLQTIPEGYTKMVSRNAAASLLGNGWTVDVIVHLFKDILGVKINEKI